MVKHKSMYSRPLKESSLTTHHMRPWHCSLAVDEHQVRRH